MRRRNHLRFWLALSAALALAAGPTGAAAPPPKPLPRHTLSGTVTGLKPGHHAVVRANKAYGKEIHTTSTRAGGGYILRGLSPGSYTVRPSHPRYRFHPNFHSVVVTGSDRVDVDFHATFIPPPKGR